MPSLVRLSVYDLEEGYKGPNNVLKAIGTGVYHAGVEVYGAEYSYGSCAGTDQGGETGVYRNAEPKSHAVHVFKQSVEMGETSLTEEQVNTLISELEREWLAEDYSLLKHNSCDFSNELCKRLDVGTVPGWVKSAAGLGALITDVPTVVPNCVSQGKLKRGATSDDAYRPGDFTVGAATSVAGKVSQTVNDGKVVRGASQEEGYLFGDFTRGLVDGVKQGVQTSLTEGKQARDASSTDSYKFGDLTRGLVASLARK